MKSTKSEKVRNECYSASELKARAELAFMGIAQCITDRDNMAYAINAVCDTLRECGMKEVATGEEIMSNFESDVRGFVFNTIQGMYVLTIILHDDEEKVQPNLDSEYGVFCYCYNFSEPLFSELGYCFFKDSNGLYKRIG